MICKNCGENLAPDSKFCSKCGAEVIPLMPITPIKPFNPKDIQHMNKSDIIFDKSEIIIKGINILGFVLVVIATFCPYFLVSDSFIFSGGRISYWEICNILDVTYFYGIFTVLISIFGVFAVIMGMRKTSVILSVLLFADCIFANHAITKAYTDNIASYFVSAEYDMAVYIEVVGFLMIAISIVVSFYNKSKHK